MRWKCRRRGREGSAHLRERDGDGDVEAEEGRAERRRVSQRRKCRAEKRGSQGRKRTAESRRERRACPPQSTGPNLAITSATLYRFALPDCSLYPVPFSRWSLLLAVSSLRSMYRPTTMIRRARDWRMPIAASHIYALLGSFADALGASLVHRTRNRTHHHVLRELTCKKNFDFNLF